MSCLFKISSKLLPGFFLLCSMLPAAEQRVVNLKEGLPYVDVDVNGKNIRIERIQNTAHKLSNSYTRTSRPTPPFFVQPFTPIPGIETVSELDLIDFLKVYVSENRGVLIDARMPGWYRNGTIPGALNLPFTIMKSDPDAPVVTQVFTLFGAKKGADGWHFDRAQTLMIFDNGPWCQQGVTLMKHLTRLGYPKEKIRYYRGGMQFWQILGITTYKPGAEQ